MSSPTICAQAKVVEGRLTDSAGFTLYVLDNDATVPGKSACVGACLGTYTPQYAKYGSKATGNYSLITRDDGRKRWAYKGKPLYRAIGDKKPGDQSGDGLYGIWHVARP